MVSRSIPRVDKWDNGGRVLRPWQCCASHCQAGGSPTTQQGHYPNASQTYMQMHKVGAQSCSRFRTNSLGDVACGVGYQPASRSSSPNSIAANHLTLQACSDQPLQTLSTKTCHIRQCASCNRKLVSCNGPVLGPHVPSPLTKANNMCVPKRQSCTNRQEQTTQIR